MSLLLLLTVLLPLLTFFLLHKQRIHGEKINPLPPGPPGLPFIGNLHQLFNSSTSPHVFFGQLSKQYGPLIYLKLSSRHTLVVSSAKMAQEVLKTHDSVFCSRPAMLALQKLSYNCLDDVFVVGTDTSAATTVWAMTLLMKHPEAMRKVQEEARGMIRSRGIVNEDDIEKLPYLKAVIKETFRLHPVVPLLLSRETIRNCTIDGYEIRAKTLVYVNVSAIGRDVEVWGENAEEFYPERFLGSSIDFKGQDFELIPFGSGRRGCPGMYMGSTAVELALANLVYKFDWEFVE